MQHLLEGSILKTHYCGKQAKKALHVVGIKPTTSLLHDVRFTAVLQPLPPYGSTCIGSLPVAGIWLNDDTSSPVCNILSNPISDEIKSNLKRRFKAHGILVENKWKLLQHLREKWKKDQRMWSQQGLESQQPCRIWYTCYHSNTEINLLWAWTAHGLETT